MRGARRSDIASPSVAALAALGFCCVLAAPVTAMAEQRRFALVVGHNRGEPHEALLRYADRDAELVARTLEKRSGFSREDIVTLSNEPAQVLRARIEDLSGRIARAREAGDEVLFLFYYSGHADSTSLHLGGTKMSFRELLEQVQQLDTPLNLMIVDACRSGILTQVKGAGPAEPFEFEQLDQPFGDRLAVIASANQGEDAQESERLRGSFFTHHLLAGLAGAADQSMDGVVTLDEAYEYARVETLRTTTNLARAQHPTSSIESLAPSVKETLVLSTLVAREDEAVLSVEKGGKYYIYSRDESALFTQFTAFTPASMVLPPGEYIVRKFVDEKIFQASIDLSAGVRSELSSGDFTVLSEREIVRKGVYDLTDSLSPPASLAVHAGAISRVAPTAGLSPMLGAQVGVWAEKHNLAMGLDLAYQQSEGANAWLRIDQRVLDVELEGAVALGVRRVGFWFGPHVGASLVSQLFETSRDAPPRTAMAYRAGAGAKVLVDVTRRMSPFVGGGAGVWLFPGDRAELETSMYWSWQLGLAWNIGRL